MFDQRVCPFLLVTIWKPTWWSNPLSYFFCRSFLAIFIICCFVKHLCVETGQHYTQHTVFLSDTRIYPTGDQWLEAIIPNSQSHMYIGSWSMRLMCLLSSICLYTLFSSPKQSHFLFFPHPHINMHKPNSSDLSCCSLCPCSDLNSSADSLP